MKMVRSVNFVAAGLLAGVLSAQPAAAVMIDFDLEDGSVFVNPNPNYFSGPISLGGPIQIDPGETLDIWINFVDAETSAQQFLKITDLGDPRDEDFGVSVEGSGLADGAPTFDVTFAGVMGNVIGTVFQSTNGSCNGGTGCVSAVFPVDLTDTSFSLQGLHISFTTPAEQIDPASISAVTFGFALDHRSLAHEIGVLAVPEPVALALFGFGLAGLGFARRRH